MLKKEIIVSKSLLCFYFFFFFLPSLFYGICTIVKNFVTLLAAIIEPAALRLMLLYLLRLPSNFEISNESFTQLMVGQCVFFLPEETGTQRRTTKRNWIISSCFNRKFHSLCVYMLLCNRNVGVCKLTAHFHCYLAVFVVRVASIVLVHSTRFNAVIFFGFSIDAIDATRLCCNPHALHTAHIYTHHHHRDFSVDLNANNMKSSYTFCQFGN